MFFLICCNSNVYAEFDLKNDTQHSEHEHTYNVLKSLSGTIHFTGNGYPEMDLGDTRKVRKSSSPGWLEAVGRIISVKSESKAQQCTLTLITDHPEKDGIIGVTAGHCVAHWAKSEGTYDVGSNSVTFKNKKGNKITRSISEVILAEMSEADYAIVKLDSSVDKLEISPLIASIYTYRTLLATDVNANGFLPFATMAGYSRDNGIGKRGSVLTYDEKCQLNGGTSKIKLGLCYTYPGASGGAVAVTVDLHEDMSLWDWQVGARTYFVGSIIGSFAGANNGETTFTPITYYIKELERVLANH